MIIFCIILISFSTRFNFYRSYDTSGDNCGGYFLHQTTDGGFIVAGKKDNYLLFSKVSNDSSIEWAIRGGGSDTNFVALGVYELVGGDILVLAGRTTNNNGFLYRINSNSLVWGKKITGATPFISGFERGCRIIPLGDGHFGWSGIRYTNPKRIFVHKFSDSGVTDWAKEYYFSPGTSDDYSPDLVLFGDGLLGILGISQNVGLAASNTVLLKIFPEDGSIDSAVSFSKSGEAQEMGFVVLDNSVPDGGFYISGIDGYFIRVDENGDISWVRKTSGGKANWNPSLGSTSDGGVVATGETDTSNNMYVYKIDNSGSLVWKKKSPYSTWIQSIFVTETREGNIAYTGIDNDDLLIAEIPSDGSSCAMSDIAITLSVESSWQANAETSNANSVDSSATIGDDSRAFSFEPTANFPGSPTCIQCMPHYFGENCDVTTCFGVMSNTTDEEICGGNGKCSYYDDCDCEPGFYGLNCTNFTALACNENYYGPVCQITSCNGVFNNDTSRNNELCGGHGTCEVYEVCECTSSSYFPGGVFGAYCDMFMCDDVLKNITDVVCNGQGECVAHDDCRCFPRFVNVTDPDSLFCANKTNGDDGDDDGTNDDDNGGDDDDDDGNGGGSGEIIIAVVATLTAGIVVLFSTLCCFCLCILLFLILFLSFFVCIGVGGGTAVVGSKLVMGGGGNMDDFDVVERKSERLSSLVDTAPKIEVDESLFVIKYKDLKVVGLIGEGGSNSCVFHCSWKGKQVAFKCFKTRDLMSSQHTYDEFEKEVNVLASIRHPYCLDFYGACMNPPRVGIVMEFCMYGDLKKFLTSEPKYPVIERIRVLREASDAIEYLHERKVIHRDLKSENVLLNENHTAKVIDFGMSKIFDRLSVAKTKAVGTSYYMAPEVTLGKKNYTEKCDVFSFAIVIWEVLSGNFHPYAHYGDDEYNIQFLVANNEDVRPKVDTIQKNIRGEFPAVIRAMKRCWQSDPDLRPSFEDLTKLFTRELKVRRRRKKVVGGQ